MFLDEHDEQWSWRETVCELSVSVSVPSLPVSASTGHRYVDRVDVRVTCMMFLSSKVGRGRTLGCVHREIVNGE